MSDLQKKFVKVVKHRLVDLDWNSSEMCRRAGISKGLWSQVSRGLKGITLGTAEKICEAVGMTVEFGAQAAGVEGEHQ